MAGSHGKQAKQIAAATKLVAGLAERLNLDASVRLWDGSRLPLGRNVSSSFELHIASPGVIGSILRRPTLDTIIRHYVNKGLDFSGGSLIEFGNNLNRGGRSVKLTAIEVARTVAQLRPFLFAPAETPAEDGAFKGNLTGANRAAGENQEFIQFHYDLTNDFYKLFLDPEMVYSCAYFTDWENDLATAQRDKLDMICRKLRLQPGDRFLDIGCGWGALISHAAKNYGVKAHGITLSQEQLKFAREKVHVLGLEDQVTLELIDYIDLTGTYDKIASVGMYEHIGLDNIPTYMRKIRSLLSEDGLFLNHAIARRAKRRSLWPDRLRPEQRALAKYIFPGGSTISATRFSRWSGPVSRCTMSRPGACTTQGHVRSGMIGWWHRKTRRLPSSVRRNTGSTWPILRVAQSVSSVAPPACSRHWRPRRPSARHRFPRPAPISISRRLQACPQSKPCE